MCVGIPCSSGERGSWAPRASGEWLGPLEADTDADGEEEEDAMGYETLGILPPKEPNAAIADTWPTPTPTPTLARNTNNQNNTTTLSSCPPHPHAVQRTLADRASRGGLRERLPVPWL